MNYCVQCGKEHASPEARQCSDCGGALVARREGVDTLVGRVLAEKYVLLEELGKGGMGSVYRAKQTTLETLVAIKLLRMAIADHPVALQRFYNEAKNSSKLKHPHNVRVFDFGHTDDGLVYIVMELVDGVPLSRIDLPLRVDRALRIMSQACGALAEAHAIGLIHRDLKPDNIMISEVDRRDFARVLDYGIAKFENSSTALTADGGIIGTPEYISPEQVSGERIDRRCDVYLLGLILYEMVTGRPPFRADNQIMAAYKHRFEEPPPPSAIADIDTNLERLILECLVKDPDQRLQSVEALRDRVEVLLNVTPAAIGVVTGSVPEAHKIVTARTPSPEPVMVGRADPAMGTVPYAAPSRPQPGPLREAPRVSVPSVPDTKKDLPQHKAQPTTPHKQRSWGGTPIASAAEAGAAGLSRKKAQRNVVLAAGALAAVVAAIIVVVSGDDAPPTVNIEAPTAADGQLGSQTDDDQSQHSDETATADSSGSAPMVGTDEGTGGSRPGPRPGTTTAAAGPVEETNEPETATEPAGPMDTAGEDGEASRGDLAAETSEEMGTEEPSAGDEIEEDAASEPERSSRRERRRQPREERPETEPEPEAEPEASPTEASADETEGEGTEEADPFNALRNQTEGLLSR